jgi:type IV pilus assembly protein PilP
VKGWALALIGALVVGVACERGATSGSAAPAGGRKPVPMAKAPAAAADQPAAEAQAPDGQTAPAPVAIAYSYDSTGKRDPFRSFVLEHARELANAERGPLEQFDLAQLSVAAVVWGTPRPRALVLDPSGRGYVVQEGTAIGKNEGRVIRIEDSQVLVRETYVDYLGEATSKEIEMRVRETQGG